MRIRRLFLATVVASFVGSTFAASLAEAKPKGKGRSHPTHQVWAGHPHGLPPGLAKKLGPTRPTRLYVALDPRWDDRAWFLLNERWVLRSLPEASLRREVRALLDFGPLPAPPLPPPIPLPRLGVELRLWLFD